MAKRAFHGSTGFSVRMIIPSKMVDFNKEAMLNPLLDNDAYVIKNLIMQNRLFFIVALSLTMLVSSRVLARDLTIYCEYLPPVKVEQGDTGGLIYDQVWELMRRTGIEKPVEKVSWKRGYVEATTLPNIALFPTTRTTEREDLFYWVGPILQVTWAFYALSDSGIEINSLEDARKVGAIGTYADDGKEQWLKAHGFTNLVSVMENVTNMKKLYNRRIDLMVGSPLATDRWPELYGFDGSNLSMVYPFKRVKLYLAVSKTSSMDTVWALEKAFKDMVQDGTLKHIYNKWVPGMVLPVK